MKTKATLLSAAVFMCTFFGTVSAFGQCTEKRNADDQMRGYKFDLKKEPTKAETDRKKLEGEMAFSQIYVTLDGPARFKIALDGDYNGAFSKSNDIVTFTVLENVYGSGKLPKDIPQPGKAASAHKDMRCVLIPKDSKVYGVVDWANSRYPFSLPRKGKIYITISKVTFEDGSEIPITFAEPLTQVAGQKEFKPLIRDCKHFSSRKCIEGRRPKIAFPTAAIGDTASAAILVAGDSDVSKGIGIFSVLTAMVKASGVGDVINPPNAELKAKMVFEVMTEGVDATHTYGAWIPMAPPAADEKKKEGEKEKKPD